VIADLLELVRERNPFWQARLTGDEIPPLT
jgi:hypothetical protein